jgi:ABC-type transporter Mla subunit MlaD
MKTESNILSIENFFEHFSVVVDVLKNQQDQINSLQDAVQALTRENEALRDKGASLDRKIDQAIDDVSHLTYMR